MELWYVFGSIVLLVLFISWGKIQPFLAFLVASSVAAIPVRRLIAKRAEAALQRAVGWLGGAGSV